MIAHAVAQGTQEWLDLRKGIPTASLFDNIVTAGGAKSDQQESYMNHLLAERILGQPIDGFKSQWMDRGNEVEHRAVASYELARDCDTEKIGFVTTDDGRIGCSPDRFIVNVPEGMLEAKAPSLPVHVSYLRAATGAFKKYKVQLMGQLWVCERAWVDIISYHPDVHRDAQNAVFRVERDEEFIGKLSAEVRRFSDRLEEIAGDFSARGWIKTKAVASDDERGYIGQSDLEWALQRSI